MTDALEKQLTGGSVTVRLGGKEYRLQYRFAAVIAYLDQTGDSLFDLDKLKKIDARVDPKRWLVCLWAGLHEQRPDPANAAKTLWAAPLTLAELSGLVEFDGKQVAELSSSMVKALAAHMPKVEEPDPKAAAPGEPAPGYKDPDLPPSSNSGLELDVATVSAVKSS